MEGIGDHGCEYMTGGMVVILGSTGNNFGAGMTGGRAYVFDEQETFLSVLNTQLVTATRLSEEDGLSLRTLIEEHVACTESKWGEQLLTDWDKTRSHFWKVTPHLPVAKPMEPEIKKEDEQTATIITEAITIFSA